jgi:hypothetical protein
MELIPEEHKWRVQSSYTRYLVLAAKKDDISFKLNLAKVIRWGGLFVLIAALFHREWPDFIGGMALFGFGGGWVTQKDLQVAYDKNADEMDSIWKDMRSINVHFPLGAVMTDANVYYGSSIGSGRLIFPLVDSEYGKPACGA